MNGTLGSACEIAPSGRHSAHGSSFAMNTVLRARGERVVSHDGTKLFVRDWGEGPTMMFLGGWNLDSETWQYVMLPLVDKGFRCVAVDRRGHGRSDDAGGGYNLDSLADDVDAVMNALDLADVILVGHSMGSAEAVRYATRHGPGRCARLALIAPVTPDGLNPETFDDIRAAIAKDFPAWLANAWPGFLSPETSPQLDAWVMGKMCYGPSLQALIECQRTVTRIRMRAELARVDLPVLVIHGDKDLSAPIEITGRPTSELIPGARLQVYADAPHGITLTHVERLCADLAAFAGK